MDHTDQELVRRCKNGDMEAFRMIVDTHKNYIATVASGILGATPEVSEIAQNVFVKFYENLGRFRGDSSIKTYLHRMTVNASLDEIRRRNRYRKRFINLDEHDSEIVDPGHASAAIEQLEDRKIVESMLATLPERQQSVVVLRLIEGYSTSETADILGIAYGTVLSRLNRALESLRKKFN